MIKMISDDCKIILLFEDKETVDYIKSVCRRKGIGLEDYILDNFEWDDQPECLQSEISKIIIETCKYCDFSDRCPDVVKRKSTKQTVI